MTVGGDRKQARNAMLSDWLMGRSKAPTQPRAPRRAKLIKKQSDLATGNDMKPGRFW